MNGNTFVASILRGPLHGLMSGSTMLITVTGRRTGRPITTPVNYYREGDSLWVLTSRNRTWWRNLRGGAAVSIRLCGQEAAGQAEVILDPQAVAAELERYIRCLPLSARSLGVRMEAGCPNAGDVQRTAQERLMVRIRLC